MTNDAIQQNSEDYGKFESANKLSIKEFQGVLDTQYAELNVSFLRDIFPRIERLVTDSFIAVHKKVDPKRC